MAKVEVMKLKEATVKALEVLVAVMVLPVAMVLHKKWVTLNNTVGKPSTSHKEAVVVVVMAEAMTNMATAVLHRVFHTLKLTPKVLNQVPLLSTNIPQLH